MKWPSMLAAVLILTTGFSSPSAQASPTMRAFQLGDTRASWITQDGQMVLSLNSPGVGQRSHWFTSVFDSSDRCGAQTEQYVWFTPTSSRRPDFQFDMLGDTVEVVVEGRYRQEPSRRVLIGITVKTAKSEWRHVSLRASDFQGPSVTFANVPVVFATKITIVNHGQNMLKNFRLGDDISFDVDTNTSHSDPFGEYISVDHVNVGTLIF